MGNPKTTHVFVVGTPRSGTSMVRHVLNRSDQLTMMNESGFFGSPTTFRYLLDLYVNPEARLVSEQALTAPYRFYRPGRSAQYFSIADWSTEEGATRLIDYFFDNPPNFWRSTVKRADRGAVLQEFLRSNRDGKALLQLFMRQFGGDRPIIGEKTPAHVFFVPTLLDWFPEARIIHTIRDPRAVFQSQKHKWSRHQPERLTRPHRMARRFGPTYEIYALLSITLGWLRTMQLDQQYRDKYPDRYLRVRYEDIVRAPDAKIKEICEFIGLTFDDDMLKHGYQNSSYRPVASVRRVQDASQPFDASAVDRWRGLISPLSKRCIDLVSKTQLQRLEYEI